MQLASIELMVEIVNYLNSALLYFLKIFFGTSFFSSLILSESLEKTRRRPN